MDPSPRAAWHFRDTRGELAGLAPPAFAIHIFEKEPAQPLESWLEANGLLRREAGWFTEPYQGRHIAGLKVISPTFMAPGWSVYVTGDGRVFQLTPLGEEGERMLETFEIEG